MPSNNSKYTPEIRERTVKYILENGKSATSVAEEMGIDTNTVCRWVRDHRRTNQLPTYHEEKGIKQVTSKSEKELNQKVREKDKRIRELEEEVEILKKSLRIFMRPQ
ncbi:MAG: hypothetical protein A2Y20_01770 [Firmicutes bacterium GWF2_51_9]|nr:MAG: hypothetical protein A2Y20_01770 [Firmicutes bacterium GWF2_51_9]OGS58626.1 MAG: hypothetical protein A2Y19_08040 [Firmicutes bacterium GWE2_51_13]HAM62510.1 hypothetical protein [Erysipelotrichaceae bacterium]